MNRCKPLPLGAAIGVLWAAYVFCIGIAAMYGWGTGLISPLASLYIGFDASVGGAIVGAVWGFIDGFIAGYVIAWIYNMMAK